MAKTWKTVRIFISSTFRDMHAERDHLVRFVFPELRERCSKRQLHLVDVDLRWGVTEEEARQGKVLEVCLDEIERCRPFFIAILGERYGWVPSHYDVPDEPQYDWVRQFDKGHSLTAMEIYHGVLRDPIMSVRAFFYFRDPAFLSDVPESSRSDFLPESDEAAEKLRVLKDEIRKRRPVFENYPCRFGGTGAGDRVMLADLESFGNRVLEDLWSAINQENPVDDDTPDDLAIERTYQEVFIEGHSQGFVGRRDLLNEMFSYADGAQPAPLVITGAPGCGKSALLANFTIEYSANHPEAFLLSHFIGASPGSTDIRRMLLRLCRELARHFTIAGEITRDIHELRQTFAKFLKQAASMRKVVLVLDALNQLDERDYAHDLGWLPQSLPPGFRLIVSALDGDCLDTLRHRKPAIQEISIGPLAEEARLEIVRNRLWAFRKRLDERPNNDQMKLLLSKSESVTPLYLIVACEEMRVFGEFEGVTERIASLPEDIAGLFQQVLERLERDHGTELVASALSLLKCSRHGLLETEMLELLAQTGARKLAPAAWARLYRSLQFYLRPAGEDGEGVLDFFHQHMANAAHEKYLADEEGKSGIHRRLAELFRGKVDPSCSEQWSATYPRGLSELPYHLLEGQLYSDLFRIARDESFLRAQAAAFNDDPDLQMETLRTAIKGAAVIDDPASMAEFVLALARRLIEVHQESPLDALRSGNLTRAWELADLHDIERCVLWHLLFAYELYEQGKTEAAQSTTERLRTKPLPRLSWEHGEYAAQLLLWIYDTGEPALTTLQHQLLSDQARRDLCNQLIIRFARGPHTGDTGEVNQETHLGDALEIAQGIEGVAYRARALSDVAAAQAEGADAEGARVTFATAVEAAQRIEIDRNRAEALSDIASAQARAGEREGAGRTLAAAIETTWDMEESWRLMALKDIGIAQARAGWVAAALQIAGMIELESPRARVLNSIAVAQAEAGEYEAAKASFDAALVAARGIDNRSFRAKAMEDLAASLANAKETDRALEIARGIELDGSRARALRNVATAQARAGDFSAALGTAGSIGTAFFQTRMVNDIIVTRALSQTLAGDYSAALETAGEIAGEGYRAPVLREIASAQATAGDSEGARATFAAALEAARRAPARPLEQGAPQRWQMLKDIAVAQESAGEREGAAATLAVAFEGIRGSGYERERDQALDSLAMAQTEAGDFAGARNTAISIELEWDQAKPLKSIAIAQARAKDFADALDTTHAIHSQEDRIDALREIAMLQTEAGEPEAARETFATELQRDRGIEDEMDRDEALGNVASALAQAGDFQYALEIAQGIPAGSSRAAALKDIASAQVNAGEQEAAQTSFVMAVQTARGLEKKSDRSQLLEDIAAAQAQAGNLIAALETARQIESARRRAEVQKDIAAKQVGAGDLEAARATFVAALDSARAINVRRFRERGPAMMDIAAAQAKAGDFAAALGTARAIEYPTYRADALRLIVNLQLHAGEFAAAIDTAWMIDLLKPRAQGLSSIATAQLLAGERTAARITFATALQTVRGMERDQAQVLRDIAKALARAGDFAAALETARPIELESCRDEALRSIARAQLRTKEFAGALETTQKIEDHSFRAKALSVAATAQLLTGAREPARATFAAAIETAQAIPDTWLRAEALKKIAAVQARSKEFDSALETARAISHESLRGQALAYIAVAQVRAGSGELATRTLNEILVDRNEHFPAVAAVFAERGDDEQFKRLLIPCADYLDAARKMCVLLARLYPDQTSAIAQAVARDH